MATRDTNRISERIRSVEGGIDSGTTPNLLPENTASFAINTTFRGGWPTCRPGLTQINLEFEDDDAEMNFKQALFQTAGPYLADDETGSIITMHGGRVFRIKVDLSDTFKVQEISISGDLNSARLPMAWNAQGENYFVIQDGQSLPFIYNGASARRSSPEQSEIPVARQITYYMGRFWIAKYRDYLGGDIVFGPSGTAALRRRDSILRFTEAKYLAEGGAFGVPVQSGNITGFKPIASINTAVGEAELIIFTRKGAFAIQPPQDRETWKNTSQLFQRVIQLSDGAVAQDSIVNVNEDLFSRSTAGIRSLAYSVRNAGQWGNTPISSEVGRILSKDADQFLPYSSGANFDNRLLMTASPGFAQGRGVYHRCLVVLDFDLITNMRAKLPPVWEGIWTGLNVLKILTVEHLGIERCFILSLSSSQNIELWELSKDNPFDNTDTRIPWAIEYRSLPFGNDCEMKQLESADLWFDRLQGSVDFDMDYRPDSYPCWIDWEEWSECGKYQLCEDEFGNCPTLPNFKEQYRPKIQLKQPRDDFDPILKTKYRTGFEFQHRLSILGKCRVKQSRFNTQPVQELPHQNRS